MAIEANGRQGTRGDRGAGAAAARVPPAAPLDEDPNTTVAEVAATRSGRHPRQHRAGPGRSGDPTETLRAPRRSCSPGAASPTENMPICSSFGNATTRRRASTRRRSLVRASIAHWGPRESHRACWWLLFAARRDLASTPAVAAGRRPAVLNGAWVRTASGPDRAGLRVGNGPPSPDGARAQSVQRGRRAAIKPIPTTRAIDAPSRRMWEARRLSTS